MNPKHYTPEEIEELLSGITQGVWKIKRDGVYNSEIVDAETDEIILEFEEFNDNQNDGNFIAASPAIIRQLLAENAKLKEELARR